jgi:hypothetical protein
MHFYAFRAKWPETVEVTTVIGDLLIWMLATPYSAVVRGFDHRV